VVASVSSSARRARREAASSPAAAVQAWSGGGGVCGGGGIGGRRIARGRRGGDAVIDGRDWRWVQRAGRRRGDDKKIKCTGSL